MPTVSLRRGVADTASMNDEPEGTGSDVFASGSPDTHGSMFRFTPSFAVTESCGTVRLQLHRVTHGEGTTLQEAADDLVRRVLGLALAFRANGVACSAEVPPDLPAVNFVYELGEIAAAGGDIRERLFG
jgi:hypothetical protein